ncbi:hypothetical protein [Flavobacterium olei]|uniref:hypothetical protein n=1 Tax=Flavobacterium olei TaxID=1886782 RepID=UPI003219F08C
MNPIDISKHTKNTLEFIFNEADKMATEILKSLAENTSKSFILVAIYSSILSYSFFQIVDKSYLYLILLVGCSISTVILGKNLFPNKIVIKGSLPEIMIDEYFNSFSGEELEKEYLATQIENYNLAINQNRKTIEKMVSRFKNSIYSMLVFMLIFLVWFLLSSTESFQC